MRYGTIALVTSVTPTITDAPDTASTAAPPSLSPETLDRLARLRRDRRALTREIEAILHAVAPIINDRATVECLRCGWTWTPFNPLIRPRRCGRCNSTAWDKPPSAISRKPDDPPSPCWPKREGKRRAKLQAEPKRILRRRTREELLAEAKDKMATVIAAEKTRTQDIDNAINKFLVPLMPPPPRIAAILPPPPMPTPSSSSPTPPPSLSQWLRDVVAAEDRSEPQPERVSSHVATPEPPLESSAPLSVDNPVETAEEVEVETEVMPSDEGRRREIEVAGDHTEPATVTSVEAPSQPPPEPEHRENTLTDRELRELAEAEEVIWPTTQDDD